MESITRKYILKNNWILLQELDQMLQRNASKNVVHKTAEPKGELIGNKIAEKTVEPKSVRDKNLRYFEEILVSPEKRQEILNGLRKTEHHKTAPKFATRKWIYSDDLLSGQYAVSKNT